MTVVVLVYVVMAVGLADLPVVEEARCGTDSYLSWSSPSCSIRSTGLLWYVWNFRSKQPKHTNGRCPRQTYTALFGYRPRHVSVARNAWLGISLDKLILCLRGLYTCNFTFVIMRYRALLGYQVPQASRSSPAGGAWSSYPTHANSSN